MTTYENVLLCTIIYFIVLIVLFHLRNLYYLASLISALFTFIVLIVLFHFIAAHDVGSFSIQMTHTRRSAGVDTIIM